MTALADAYDSAAAKLETEANAAPDPAEAGRLRHRATRLREHAEIQRDPAHRAATSASRDRREAARRWAFDQVRELVLADPEFLIDVELAHDAGLYRGSRRAEALAAIEAVIEFDREYRQGVEGRLAPVSRDGLMDGSPLDPRLAPAWAVVHVAQPEYWNRLEPDWPLKDILQERISIFSGYAGERAPCEFSSAVSGDVGGGACACRFREGSVAEETCCTGRASGWVLDPIREKEIILVWLACAQCLKWAADTGPIASDCGGYISDPHGTHSARIDAVNKHHAEIENWKIAAKLKKLLAAKEMITDNDPDDTDN
ncbi:hypothetical protein BH09ACT7_BH09ACT7_37550 [soil metagenome]